MKDKNQEIKDRPVYEIRTGQIKGIFWKNVNDDGKEYLSLNIQKIFKDKNDTWKTTNTFNVADIPKIQIVLNKCYEYACFPEKEVE